MPGTDGLIIIIALCLGIVLGAAAVWFATRSRSAFLKSRLSQVEEDLKQARQDLEDQQQTSTGLRTEIARLETTLQHERKEADEKLALLDQAKTQLSDAFTALSSEALKSSNQSFLELAKATLEKYQVEAKGDLEQREKAVENLVSPIRESLEKINIQIQELEKSRVSAYAGLTEQVKSLVGTQEKLQAETGSLVRALRSPVVRGRWGEIQLKRVVEMAGMVPYCDYVEQASVTTDEGRLRPDLIVRLPGGKNVVVDAKAPLQAFLDAQEAESEEERLAKLKDHARQVRAHMIKLSAKNYWQQFESTPEFVVMFLPGESLFSAALEQDARLIEEGSKQRVILATPITLIALLRTVASVWRQEEIAENALEISNLGREVYERLSVTAKHFNKVGRSLDGAVEAFNKTVGSLEARVLPAVRRFTDLGVSVKEEISALSPVERLPRHFQSPELANSTESADPPPDDPEE